MGGMDWNRIEAKWQERWRAEAAFEANPDGRPKKFVTVAYPYPNSPQHVGHGRTYTLADVHARFWRMRGYNVLFPMGFHYTGTPILGMAKRVQAGDAELMGNLRNLYGVPEEALRGFAEPVRIADYFHEEIRAGMVEMGYSIDWRREFTTIDPAYQKFIEWQVGTLRERGLITQGSHPVGWCPSDENPVSQHDTIGDVEPEFTEYVLVKFAWDGYTIPTATLRPETVFGVTNLWVNPGITYEKVTVDGEKWIVSPECARKLGFLDRKVVREGEISGSELAGREATSYDGRKVVMLAAGFVESGTGTGIVMSVPAHAPFDYQALEDLKAAGNADAAGIEPAPVIATQGYGAVPAAEAVGKLGITGQDDPRLEEATKEVYSAEFYGGQMSAGAGRFAGMKVSEAKDAVGAWLGEGGHADVLLELTGQPVRCRCGAECVVKILNDQWFINYGDAGWKKKAVECLDSMGILPQEIRQEFLHVVDWLRERACARQHGLGTRLPWDDGWIVESLADSVIYMAYYTIARLVNDGTLSAERLSPAFFDHVFLGRGEAAAVSEETGVPEAALREARGEFEYFYPVDSRHSGRDLVPNHLTFFVLNHVAVFPRERWPRQIVVNGSVLMDGSKMSKSMGNIIPLRKAIREHGADPIRLAIIISAELLQDADFNMESVSGTRGRLEALYSECSPAPGGPGTEAEDRWLLAMCSGRMAQVTAAIEKMRLREALHEILSGFGGDLSWYRKRAAAKGRTGPSGTVWRVNSARVAMLAPFAPHIAEEMWERLGCEGQAAASGWPAAREEDADPEAVHSEALLRGTMDDIASILRVTGITPRRITVYTADPAKYAVYRGILGAVAEGRTGMGPVMKGLLADPETAAAKAMPEYVQKAIKDVLSETPEIRQAREGSGGFDEAAFLASEMPGLAGREFGAEVRVLSAADAGTYDPKGKARHARPFKPAILVE